MKMNQFLAALSLLIQDIVPGEIKPFQFSENVRGQDELRRDGAMHSAQLSVHHIEKRN